MKKLLYLIVALASSSMFISCMNQDEVIDEVSRDTEFLSVNNIEFLLEEGCYHFKSEQDLYNLALLAERGNNKNGTFVPELRSGSQFKSLYDVYYEALSKAENFASSSICEI